MKTFLTYVSLVLLTVVGTARSQSSIPDIQWTKPYRGYLQNAIRTSITADGSIVFGGYKLSVSGDTLFRVNDNYSFPVGSTPDGGIIAFYHDYGQPGLSGYAIRGGFRKIDASGREVFQKELYKSPDAPKYPTFYLIKQVLGTPDNGVVLLYLNGTVTRYSATGEQLWSKILTHRTNTGGSEAIRGQSVCNTPDGGLLVVGYNGNSFSDVSNFFPIDDIPVLGAISGWAAKLDGQGNLQWEKLLTGFSFGNGRFVQSTLAITDVIPAADGNGYALAGIGYGFSSRVQAPARAVLLELDPNGNLKRGRVYATLEPTPTYLTVYTGGDGQRYYALGNNAKPITSSSDSNYQLLKISAAPLYPVDNEGDMLAIVAQRTFSLSDYPERMTSVAVAGDGGLVMTGSTGLIKLFPERRVTALLTLKAPTYNCQTGAIFFNTSGGDGTPIVYTAPGVTRSSLTSPAGIVEQELRNDPKTILIQATQSGQTVSYVWDLKAYCQAGTPLQMLAPTYNCQTGAITFNTLGGDGTPIVYTAPGVTRSSTTSPTGTVERELRNDPKTILIQATQSGRTVSYALDLKAFCQTGTPLQMLAPTYNCQTGTIVFNTSGGDGTPIVYTAPGVTRSALTSPTGTVEQELRNDPKTILIQATQSGQTVSYAWNLQTACSGARQGVAEVDFWVGVLGNPTDGLLRVQIRGAEGQPVGLRLIDLRGNSVESRQIESAGRREEQTFRLSESGPGVLLLEASSGGHRQTLRVIKQ